MTITLFLWYCFVGGGHAGRGGVGDSGRLHDATFTCDLDHVTASAATQVAPRMFNNLRCYNFGSVPHIWGCQNNPRQVCDYAVKRCGYVVPCLG